MASLTIENYVKAIYQISAQQDWQAAATGKLAEALRVSPGTVTSMLKTLSESGLAEYVPYEGARLTEAGCCAGLWSRRTPNDDAKTANNAARIFHATDMVNLPGLFKYT